jgi:putative ABC transport system permease protein
MVGAVLTFAIAFRLLGFPDLTVEGSVPLGGAMYAVLVQHGMPPMVAVTLACTAGAVAGASTALLNIRFGVNKFLAGIVVVAILYSSTLRLMSGPNISLLQAPSLMRVPRSLFSLNPRLGVALFLCVLWSAITVALMMYFKSRSGIRLRAAGSNPAFAESLGVRSGVAIVLGLAGCNALGALAGSLQADLQGFADVSGGQGVLILGLAALAIGEALVPKRRVDYYKFVILAAVVGSVVYHVLIAYAVRAGLATTDLRLATGLLVLFVVSFRLSKEDQNLEAMGGP